jgi:hypothetical protein
MRLYLYPILYYVWRHQNQNQTNNDDPVDIPRKSFKFN